MALKQKTLSVLEHLQEGSSKCFFIKYVACKRKQEIHIHHNNSFVGFSCPKMEGPDCLYHRSHSYISALFSVQLAGLKKFLQTMSVTRFSVVKAIKAKNQFYFLGLTISSFTTMMENLMQSSKLFYTQHV